MRDHLIADDQLHSLSATSSRTSMDHAAGGGALEDDSNLDAPKESSMSKLEARRIKNRAAAASSRRRRKEVLHDMEA